VEIFLINKGEWEKNRLVKVKEQLVGSGTPSSSEEAITFRTAIG